MASAYGGSVDVPINGDGLDIEHRIHQPLVAQVAQHQQLGLRAQRHQGDEFALVHIDGERTLCGNLHLLALAQFIDGLHTVGERRLGLRQARQGGHGISSGREKSHGPNIRTYAHLVMRCGGDVVGASSRDGNKHRRAIPDRPQAALLQCGLAKPGPKKEAAPFGGGAAFSQGLCRYGDRSLSGLGCRSGSSGHQGAGRAAGRARWRVCASRLSGLVSGRGVGEGAWVGAGCACCRSGLGRRCGLAIVGCHPVLRLAQFVVVHLASPGSLGGRLCSLGGGFRRRGWQFGRGQRAHTGCAQRQQRRTENLRHGAKPHTCAGWPADGVAAASAAGCWALRWRAILPAWTSSYQSSWCSLAHASLT